MTKCAKCGGSGLIAYDQNHMRPCEVCCTHPIERRYIQGKYQPNPGIETCGLCGTEFHTAAKRMER